MSHRIAAPGSRPVQRRIRTSRIRTQGPAKSSGSSSVGERPSSYSFLPDALYRARMALAPAVPSAPSPTPLALPTPSAPRPVAGLSTLTTDRLKWTPPERRPRPPPTQPWALDPAHRLPTLWGLYRDLWREASQPGRADLRRWVWAEFREKRTTDDVGLAAASVRRGYELLESLRDPPKLERVLSRLKAYYDKQDRQWDKLAGFRLRHTGGPIRTGNETRGILTGHLVHASKLNRPFPLMKPQPHRISMMMARREQRLCQATDVITLHKLAKANPHDALLRQVAEDPDFQARVTLARRRTAAAEAMARESPTPELFVRMLPYHFKRVEYRERQRLRKLERAQRDAESGLPAGEAAQTRDGRS